ncbi:rhoptry neck protein 6 [Reticulomyxa filosa]|uniref:Rhoptry neck protein 6 n=1 Tax=Reticulomyxa filosa TaxID=46433 RepID=X6LS57_RETFI|nr:rhoptry neck protein 6 [Reticulomyxa filosa]|eukprot:ETO04226.1 rhoptry neck protein 6 [Reticulomyxa filosa]
MINENGNENESKEKNKKENDEKSQSQTNIIDNVDGQHENADNNNKNSKHKKRELDSIKMGIPSMTLATLFQKKTINKNLKRKQDCQQYMGELNVRSCNFFEFSSESNKHHCEEWTDGQEKKCQYP